MIKVLVEVACQHCCKRPQYYTGMHPGLKTAPNANLHMLLEAMQLHNITSEAQTMTLMPYLHSTLSTSVASACTSGLSLRARLKRLGKAPAAPMACWSASLSAPMKYSAIKHLRTKLLSGRLSRLIMGTRPLAATMSAAAWSLRASLPNARMAPFLHTNSGHVDSMLMSAGMAPKRHICSKASSMDVRELRV